MAKYEIESKSGLHTVVYEDLPIAVFPHLIDAQTYVTYLENGKLANYKAETKKAEKE